MKLQRQPMRAWRTPIPGTKGTTKPKTVTPPDQIKCRGCTLPVGYAPVSGFCSEWCARSAAACAELKAAA